MVFRRRGSFRRKRQVRWVQNLLPTSHTVLQTQVAVVPTSTLQFFSTDQDIPPDTGHAVGVLATDPVGGIYRQFSDSGYRVERIVGDCWVAMDLISAIAETQASVNWEVRMGLCVLDYDFASDTYLNEEDWTLGPATNAPAELGKAYESESRRWIWRRNWRLSNYIPDVGEYTGYVGGASSWLQPDNNAVIAGDQPDITAYPRKNWEYQNVHMGPHVDIKPRVTVGQGQRLAWRFYACDLENSLNSARAAQFRINQSVRALVSRTSRRTAR